MLSKLKRNSKEKLKTAANGEMGHLAYLWMFDMTVELLVDMTFISHDL